MKCFICILVASVLASLSFGDDTIEVSGMKVKRFGSRESVAEGVPIEEPHSEERSSDKRTQKRPTGEMGSGSAFEPSQHFLGESLVFPKRRPFTDW